MCLEVNPEMLYRQAQFVVEQADWDRHGLVVGDTP